MARRSPALSVKTYGLTHLALGVEDIDAAAERVRRAGGTITEQGEFVSGEPYLFARDLDGYLLEIWYELPTPADPR